MLIRVFVSDKRPGNGMGMYVRVKCVIAGERAPRRFSGADPSAHAVDVHVCTVRGCTSNMQDHLVFHAARLLSVKYARGDRNWRD